MPSISRRDLLSSGLALSASSILPPSAWASTPALSAAAPDAISSDALRAVAPREQLLFDFGWKFTFGNENDPSKYLSFGRGQGDFSKTASPGLPPIPSTTRRGAPSICPTTGPWNCRSYGTRALMSHGYKPLGRNYPATSVGW